MSKRISTGAYVLIVGCFQLAFDASTVAAQPAAQPIYAQPVYAQPEQPTQQPVEKAPQPAERAEQPSRTDTQDSSHDGPVAPLVPFGYPCNEPPFDPRNNPYVFGHVPHHGYIDTTPRHPVCKFPLLSHLFGHGHSTCGLGCTTHCGHKGCTSGACSNDNGCRNGCSQDGCSWEGNGNSHCRSHGLSNRGTLMQWSYGTSFGGGPDLSEPLVTDRPDFTEASSTVGVGVAQLEFGYTYIYDDEGDMTVKTHSLGEPLLRYGVYADWLELRFFLPPMQESVSGSGATTGVGDLGLGMKIALTPQEGDLPEMAIIPQINVPTGSAGFSSDEFEPGVNWVYSWEVYDDVSFAGSSQVNRRVDDGTGDGYVEYAQSLSLGRSYSDRLGSYMEWFVLVPSGADTESTQHFINSGITYLINNDMQFDFRVGRGLNDAADDFFIGTGLSIRYQ